jgi:hypothetical protein
MTLGLANNQGDLLDDVTRFCDETLDEHSIYAFLYRQGGRLFPDEAFADLFDDKGPRSVPLSVVAVLMVIQRLEGLSSTTSGATRPVSAAMTPKVGGASFIPSWSTCASACGVRTIPIASSSQASDRLK